MKLILVGTILTYIIYAMHVIIRNIKDTNEYIKKIDELEKYKN